MKDEEKKEEGPPDQAEPEPTEVWKVCYKSTYLASSLSDLDILTPWPGRFSKH